MLLDFVSVMDIFIVLNLLCEPGDFSSLSVFTRPLLTFEPASLYLTISSCKRPRGHLDRKIHFLHSNPFTHPHSSHCSDLTVFLIVTRLELWTGQMQHSSPHEYIFNFFLFFFDLPFCRQAVEKADSNPGTPGWWEAMSIPDGAVEALPGEALLQLEIQQLVWVQDWGQ